MPNSLSQDYSPQDHQTWRELFRRQEPLRDNQLIPEFSKGLQLLGITGDGIPDLQIVNSKLQALTGWQGLSVKGFEAPENFFVLLARKQFPVGHFIRDIKDLSYTPEPDVFHDLYGHIPFFTIPAYARFCEEFGIRACQHLDDPQKIVQFQRLFWFTIEFAVIKSKVGRRIFGAGIASSFGECAYALSDKPHVVPFNLKKIKDQDFRIDLIQDLLFELESEDELYSCLDQFEQLL